MVSFKVTGKQKKVSYNPHPKFGTCFTPNELRMIVTAEDFKNPSTKLEAEIRPFEPELYSPATIALHYGQSIFEGLKAYRLKDGGVGTFRADLHAKRFRKSAAKLAMPDFKEEVFMQCLDEFLKFEKDCVPSEPGHALYIRPLLIGSDEIMKVGRSKKYTFYILTCIVGDYFAQTGNKAARVLVNRKFVRAFPGGLGEAKTAGNYAASLAPQAYAETLGCDQVLYLDAIHHDFVDELGGMNFFAVRGAKNEIVTPALSGTILHGVTRQSILEIAPTLGLKAKEEAISFKKLREEILNGTLTEVFACGTAAVVQPLGELLYQEDVDGRPESLMLAAGKEGKEKGAPISAKILDTLSKMQRGQIAAPPNWIHKIPGT